MATIAVDTFLDGGVARTAGEAWTINSGAKLTIRTDSRVHANAPASMTGSLGSITINEGECIIDARNVRWLAYNTGTGNVPVIGTTISQGGVSGYLLGVWASLTSAPTAAAAAMPATGYIKLREVSGGPFSAGTLTGIGASATGPDVTGWLEVVLDDASNITVPRLGKFTTRGDWFNLDNTNGSRGQIIQVPTNGGGSNTYCPGLWVETSPSSGVYEQWPALNGANNGWSVLAMGAAEGQTDDRHKFVKMLAGGRLQFGETVTFSSTYASLAAQASTYADWNVSGTYTLTSNVCTVFCSGGHGLFGGETVGLDFTSGTAADQTGTATVLDAYYFTVPVTNANTSGNVTVRLGATVTFAAHGLSEGNQVYLTVSTGTLPSGTYTVHSMETFGVYNVLYSHTTALTSGNCSALHTLTITRTAHGHAIGNKVYLDFTSGGATDGVYTVRAIATNTYNINYPHSAAIATSNVTERFEIGKVPASGCKIRVPNVFGRACTTGARASNTIPHAALVSRPEFLTTTAGAIDIEYFYDHGWYQRYGTAYSVKMWHSTAVDTLEITNCASPLDLKNVFVGHYTGGTNTVFVSTSNTSGGTVEDCKFFGQGAPSGTRHAGNIQFCLGQTFRRCQFGHLMYARAGYGAYLNSCSTLTLEDCTGINSTSSVYMQSSSNIKIDGLTHIDRFNGLTNATNGAWAVQIALGSSNVTIDGITWAEGQHPYYDAVHIGASSNVKSRNVGSIVSPLPCGSFEPNLYAPRYLFNSAGNNTNIKVQRCGIAGVRTGLIGSLNTDVNVTLEHIRLGLPHLRATATLAWRRAFFTNSSLTARVKGISGVVQTTSGQTSVYGTHWHSLFGKESIGSVVIAMNEPTAETAGQFTMVSGTAKFNSAGGIPMGAIGNQAIWETPDWILGHTGFQNVAPVMSGGTIGNYTLEYQIDTGSGYSAWKTLNGTNLSGETISPATGFKLKVRITTTSTNTTAITYLRLATTTTAAAQNDNLYPLDTVTTSLTANVSLTGAEIRVYDMNNVPAGSLGTEIAGAESSGSAFSFSTTGNNTVWIQVMKPGYQEFGYEYTTGLVDATLPITLTADGNT